MQDSKEKKIDEKDIFHILRDLQYRNESVQFGHNRLSQFQILFQKISTLQEKDFDMVLKTIESLIENIKKEEQKKPTEKKNISHYDLNNNRSQMMHEIYGAKNTSL